MGAISAFSPSGEVRLPAARLNLDIHHANGKDEQGNLVVVYDPGSGRYLWRYVKSNHPGDTTSFWDALEDGREAVYAGPNALVDFFVNSRLYVKAYVEGVSSMGAAEKASMNEILKGLPVSEMSGYHTDSKEIPLFSSIGSDFACPPVGDPKFTQMCRFGIKSIPSISKEGETWRVVLRNRWDQEVILDSRFNLVSTQRVSEPSNR
jgi:hypothetical protein